MLSCRSLFDAYGVRRYEGLVPEWDASNPIHLVGHRSPSPLPRCRGEVFTISNANVQREYSYGGNTALELQRLLHEQVSPLNRTVASAGCPLTCTSVTSAAPTIRQAFSAHSTSPSWICSLSTISSPLNGSLALYPLGLDEADAPATVRPRSLTSMYDGAHRQPALDFPRCNSAA